MTKQGLRKGHTLGKALLLFCILLSGCEASVPDLTKQEDEDRVFCQRMGGQSNDQRYQGCRLRLEGARRSALNSPRSSETNWTALITVLSALAAACLFLFRAAAGYFYTNLTIELAVSRNKVPGAQKDHGNLTIKLSKGDRGALALQDIKIRKHGESVSNLPPPQVSRYGYNRNKDAPSRYELNLADEDEASPVLNLTPGESVQFGVPFQASCSETCTLEVIVLGQSVSTVPFARILVALGLPTRVAQWRSTIVSLPPSSNAKENERNVG